MPLSRLRLVAASALLMSATDISDRARVSDGPAIAAAGGIAAAGDIAAWCPAWWPAKAVASALSLSTMAAVGVGGARPTSSGRSPTTSGTLRLRRSSFKLAPPSRSPMPSPSPGLAPPPPPARSVLVAAPPPPPPPPPQQNPRGPNRSPVPLPTNLAPSPWPVSSPLSLPPSSLSLSPSPSPPPPSPLPSAPTASPNGLGLRTGSTAAAAFGVTGRRPEAARGGRVCVKPKEERVPEGEERVAEGA